MNWTYHPKNPAPRPLDVLWCHFPSQPFTGKLAPGPKTRPGLVRSVGFDPDTNHLAVEVTYGTSRMNRAVHFNLFVTQIPDLRAAGLVIATRFDLRTTIRLPWAAEFFSVRGADGKGPIIGRLSAQSQRQLKVIAGKMNSARRRAKAKPKQK